MGKQAAAAILDTVRQDGIISPALPRRKIQGTEAEQAIKILRIRSLMAGKVFALFIAEEIEMGHGNLRIRITLVRSFVICL